MMHGQKNIKLRISEFLLCLKLSYDGPIPNLRCPNAGL